MKKRWKIKFQKEEKKNAIINEKEIAMNSKIFKKL